MMMALQQLLQPTAPATEAAASSTIGSPGLPAVSADAAQATENPAFSFLLSQQPSLASESVEPIVSIGEALSTEVEALLSAPESGQPPVAVASGPAADTGNRLPPAATDPARLAAELAATQPVPSLLAAHPAAVTTDSAAAVGQALAAATAAVPAAQTTSSLMPPAESPRPEPELPQTVLEPGQQKQHTGILVGERLAMLTAATTLPASTPAALPAVQTLVDTVQMTPLAASVAVDEAAALPADLTRATTLPPMQRQPGQPGWNQELGSRIQWMAGEQVQHAQLRLNPRHLGPIDIRVTVNNDQATVNFISQHAVVREVLEAAIPRLREMMSEAGINLTQTSISQQHTAQDQQRQASGQLRDQAMNRGADDAFLSAPEQEFVAYRTGSATLGQIDFYA